MMEIMWGKTVQAKKTNGSSKNSKDMKAWATEINIWDGNLKERFTAAADVPSWVSPGLICKVTDVLGMGQCWGKELVSLGQVCSQCWATPRCPWSIPDLLQLWLWCWCFKDDYATPHLYFLKSLVLQKASTPSWQHKYNFDWLTDPILFELVHPHQLVLSHLFLFLWAKFSLDLLLSGLLGALSATMPRYLWFHLCCPKEWFSCLLAVAGGVSWMSTTVGASTTQGQSTHIISTP